MISKGPALRDQVYIHLRDRIISGDFHPGEFLVEADLAEELKVSRTPVSNALVMLKERGLLEDHGGKAQVPILELADIVNLYWCRMALDGVAARLAATTISDLDLKRLQTHLQAWESPPRESDDSALWVSDLNFHNLIYEVTGNRHLMRFSQIAAELAAVYRRNTIRRLDEPGAGARQRSREDVRREHEAIFEAVRARDADGAEAAARAHIRNVIQHLERADLLDDTIHDENR